MLNIAVFTSRREAFINWKKAIAGSSHINFFHAYEEQQLHGRDIDGYIELYPHVTEKHLKAIAEYLIARK